ncbi:MAG TPA: HAD-IA family hydrolase [Gemmataceae bacterium]|nr:HAD-IA family hydrolase [Gemmataceae bacterium]
MAEPLQSYAAVLFDFDGTLADSYSAIAASVNHVRAQRGLAELSLDAVKRYVGRGADYLLTHTVPGGDLEADLACYRAHHPSVMMTMTEFLPGVASLLPALHRVGKKIGLCSNKPRIFSQELLQYLKVAALFDVVLGPEDVASPKPAPDMLLHAIDRLALPKDRVLYVGDMVVDIQTARSAGVPVWAVATGSEDRANLVDAKPDRLLASLEEMLAEVGS